MDVLGRCIYLCLPLSVENSTMVSCNEMYALAVEELVVRLNSIISFNIYFFGSLRDNENRTARKVPDHPPIGLLRPTHPRTHFLNYPII